jgi:hypothetical protein
MLDGFYVVKAWIGGALGGPTLICMCLVGPVWCFLFRRMERTTFGKQTLGSKPFFLYLFILATFANVVKKCVRFGKCKSYNAKHGLGWVVGMDLWTRLLPKNINQMVCVCMCVFVCVCVCTSVIWLSMLVVNDDSIIVTYKFCQR